MCKSLNGFWLATCLDMSFQIFLNMCTFITVRLQLVSTLHRVLLFLHACHSFVAIYTCNSNAFSDELSFFSLFTCTWCERWYIPCFFSFLHPGLPCCLDSASLCWGRILQYVLFCHMHDIFLFWIYKILKKICCSMPGSLAPITFFTCSNALASNKPFFTINFTDALGILTLS